nr:MAG TPA: hypothetical protein [Caudoviricetes sp.]
MIVTRCCRVASTERARALSELVNDSGSYD